MNKSYTELLNKFENKENIFILGAGPSLWANMQDEFFHKLREYGIIITVNSAILAWPNCDFWISNDHLATKWSWFREVRFSSCIKIVRDSWLKYRNDINGYYIFEPRKTPEDKINFEDKGLCYSCSISSSIDFSLKLNCKKIFVLGLDHNLIEEKHHFWQFFDKKFQPRQIEPAQGNWKQQSSVFPIHLQSYKTLKKFEEYKNCKIYNCNPSSNVEVFEKIKFKEIKKILKKKEG